MNRRSFITNLGCATLAMGMSTTSFASAPPTPPQMTTSERITLALQRLKEGYHCSQCVFEPYATELGIPTSVARKMSAALAGGSIQGGECGAIGSGYLILGAKLGPEHPRIPDGPGHNDMMRMSKKIHQFVDRFTTRFGFITCEELTGVNVFSAEERKLGRESGAYADCGQYISHTITLIDQLAFSLE